MADIPYKKERLHIEKELARGVRSFDRNNPYVQTLLRAAGNMPEIASFVQTTELRSRLH